jgi:hypothetical protein
MEQFWILDFSPMVIAGTNYRPERRKFYVITGQCAVTDNRPAPMAVADLLLSSVAFSLAA